MSEVCVQCAVRRPTLLSNIRPQ